MSSRRAASSSRCAIQVSSPSWVEREFGTVEWPGGVDLDPDGLYSRLTGHSQRSMSVPDSGLENPSLSASEQPSPGLAEGGKLPTVSRFFGISIRIYSREHAPAHFHAIYGGAEATLSIDTLEVLTGALPRRVLALVVEWAMMHRPELRENWRLAQAHQPLRAIRPLDEEV